jgi:hypothetical protein
VIYKIQMIALKIFFINPSFNYNLIYIIYLHPGYIQGSCWSNSGKEKICLRRFSNQCKLDVWITCLLVHCLLSSIIIHGYGLKIKGTHGAARLSVLGLNRFEITMQPGWLESAASCLFVQFHAFFRHYSYLAYS